MKQLTAVIAMLFVSIQLQAQGYLSGSYGPAEKFYSMEIGANIPQPSGYLFAYFGYDNNNFEGKWIKMGIGYEHRFVELFGLDVLAGIDAKIMGGQTESTDFVTVSGYGAGSRIFAGLGLPVGSVHLSVTSGLENVLYQELNTQWVPISLRLYF